MKSKILVFTAILCVLSASCSRKWCQSHYIPSVDSIYKYVVKDSIVIKDTTIYIHLPGEVVHDSVPIPCPDPGPAYVPKKVRAETSLAWAEAWFQFPNIKLLLVQKDTTIEERLRGVIIERNHYKSLYEKLSIKPEPVKFIPSVYKIALWLWAGVIIAVAGYIAVRLFVFKK